MTRKRLPSLPETGRRYVEHTMRARLASPGVERFQARPGGPWRALVALVLLAALVAAMLLLS